MRSAGRYPSHTATALLLVLGCARMEPPPGGPPDDAPPQLVQTVPDSFATLPDFDDDVEFRFDEVISEGSSPSQGQGTGDLEKLIIVSPTTRFPRVRWRRNHISVRPDEGWQPDRVYRVELLPGVTDLQRNRSTRGALLTFSTGAPRPDVTYEGTVVDWTSARPAPLALVVATLLPDSLPYRGLADSSGHFSLGPLPSGEYILSGVLDENRNHVAEPREAFDTVRVKGKRDSALELWTFVHDTAPPRVRSVTPVDSASATVEFTQPLDPKLRIQPNAVRVSLLPDSTPVRLRSVLPRPLDDSLNAKKPSAIDTAAADTAAADTVVPRMPAAPGARPPRQRKPTLEPLSGRLPLTDQLVLRPAAPWRPGARYFVEIRGVRNVTGVAGDVVGTLVVPEPPARDTLTAPGDSVSADSTRGKPPPSKPAPSRAPAKPVPVKPIPAKPTPTTPQ